MTEPTSSRRAELVAIAAKIWGDTLIDLGGRNNLLYYRNLSVGTLDLRDADPAALRQLRSGKPVRLSRLFQGSGLAPLPLRSARRIREKIRELDEERGIRAGYLAVGFATWADPDGRREPRAPVLLRPVRIEPVGAAQDDFTLILDDEIELNPVLVHVLETVFGVSVDSEEIASLVDLSGGMDAQPALQALAAAAVAVEGFSVTGGEVVGTFSYAKLPMVADLKSSAALMVEHDLVAAIAGDPDAAAALRPQGVEPGHEAGRRPEHEFLVLDADASQTRAIDSVLTGGQLVMKGPPGTGKSQTIANLISSLVAHGQSVLFVAEKRAAIDAVTRRLEEVGLADLVMDMHEGSRQRRAVAQSLAQSLDHVDSARSPQHEALYRRLHRSRDELDDHARRLHRPLEPWGVSLYDAQAASMTSPGGVAARTRFTGQILRRLTREVVEMGARHVGEFVRLGVFDSSWSDSPWVGADVRTAADGERALTLALSLATGSLPAAVQQFHAVLAQTGLRRPDTLADWPAVLDLLEAVESTTSSLAPAVFVADLPRLVAATGKHGYRRRTAARMSIRGRLRLVKSARSCWRGGRWVSRRRLHSALLAAKDVAERWAVASADGGLPRLPANLDAARPAHAALLTDLRALESILGGRDLLSMDEASLGLLVGELTSDVATLGKLPRWHQLLDWLHDYGLASLLDEARQRGLGADDSASLLIDAWYRSVLDDQRLADPGYGAFTGQGHADVVAEFVAADAAHVAAAPERVRWAAASRLVESMNEHADQARLIRAEAAKRSRHRPVRDLWRLAPDVLLALKPCWAVSPLVVSQVLPARRMFDVVIFDEASQVPPAEAVCSLLRAGRAVVAGDERQLPPTAFFVAAVTEDEDPAAVAEAEGAFEVSLTNGYESILDVLGALLPTATLDWHYRSRDERLIAFSNAHLYDSRLVTFPGVRGEDTLRHVLVPQPAPAAGQERSVIAEAERVVDLVIQHAEIRPEESLGVIALGIKHAERIQSLLLERLAARRDLDAFFALDRPEPFFVKNLERVQGDERDAVILTVGYGKDPDGRLRYHWGPINAQGGERRLNVAVTRAKRRMTAVSSFSAGDVDGNALGARGAKLLCSYLAFAASGGTELGAQPGGTPPLDPLLEDIRRRLLSAGLPVRAQYGLSATRIEFAIEHPTDPGRQVLAVETDGPAYASARTARDRDRLRQRHLETLGWSFHRVWSTDWCRNPDAEVAKLRLAYERATAEADQPEQRVLRPDPSRPDPIRSDATRPGPARPGSSGPDLTRPGSSRPRRPDPSPTGQARPSPPASRLPPRPRPSVPVGRPITEYSADQLREVVRYLLSDGRLRTNEDILRDVMGYLGFNRAGSRIRSAIGVAIAAELPSSAPVGDTAVPQTDG